MLHASIVEVTLDWNEQMCAVIWHQIVCSKHFYTKHTQQVFLLSQTSIVPSNALVYKAWAAKPCSPAPFRIIGRELVYKSSPNNSLTLVGCREVSQNFRTLRFRSCALVPLHGLDFTLDPRTHRVVVPLSVFLLTSPSSARVVFSVVWSPWEFLRQPRPSRSPRACVVGTSVWKKTVNWWIRYFGLVWRP